MFTTQVALCLLALVGAVAMAAPAVELTTPLPNGDFYGTINIYPYQRSGSGFSCVRGCSGPVAAPARMIFYQNSMILNITASSNHGCGLGSQSYYFYNLEPHTGGAYPYYYVGYSQIEGSTISICFYFDSRGTLKIKLDGQGSCPADNEPAACTNGWSAGTVTQTWSGNFQPSTVPTGNYFGTMSVVPYTKTGSQYACTTCYPVSTSISVIWNGDSAVLSMQGGGSSTCVLYTQSYTFSRVTEYGTQYPNYYYGSITVEGYDVPVCFYWDNYGNVIVKIDGQGGCPSTSDQAVCSNSAWYPGTVTQTWTGHVTANTATQTE